MGEDTSREDLLLERRLNLVELREDIADLRDVIMELNKIVATQSAEIAAMSREIAELRSFRNGALTIAATAAIGALAFFLQKFFK
ncbi:hypothetical protein ACAX43_12475 [Paraburkholderia sp. IW21]|uniref:hypothetical protein n=1 Tax=Paraburkholderia sp. IW21 TaxID=3242488 RepID=UPI0035228276